jgi:hypothetical protein
MLLAEIRHRVLRALAMQAERRGGSSDPAPRLLAPTSRTN